MLGRGAGGPSNSTSYGNESFVRCRVNTLPRDSSLMDIAELTKNRERVVINKCCSQNDAFFDFGSGRLNQWRHLQASNRRETIVTEYFGHFTLLPTSYPWGDVLFSTDPATKAVTRLPYAG